MTMRGVRNLAALAMLTACGTAVVRAPAAPASVSQPRGCDKVDAVMAERARGGKPVELEIVSQEAPRMLNARVVQRTMQDSASALSADSAVYVTRLKYHVTALGGPDQFVVVRSSGAAGIDSVVIWGMSQARFTPERVNGCPVAVWIEQDLTVQPRHKRRRAAPAPESGVQGRPQP